MGERVPERIRWAVRLLDVKPDDEILEIGAGPGVSVSLVCERLDGGHISAVDRSATAVERAARRNAGHVAAGIAAFRHAALADLEPGGRRFDKVFAINVNLFWTGPADRELNRIKELLRPGGALHLFYEPPGKQQASRVTGAVTAALERHGFAASVTTGSPSLLCVTGRPG